MMMMMKMAGLHQFWSSLAYLDLGTGLLLAGGHRLSAADLFYPDTCRCKNLPSPT